MRIAVPLTIFMILWFSLTAGSGFTQPLTVSPDHPDPTGQAGTQDYLSRLVNQGADPARQAVWIQTSDRLLANQQGTLPLPVASITKVATALAALQQFGYNHRFVTVLGIRGSVENGTVNGDLVVQGSGDPFFVWEDAIAIGNLLNEHGITRVSGNLVITGTFYMNFFVEAEESGKLLKQGLNAPDWSAETQTQYVTLPAGTPRPHLEIQGSVQVDPGVPQSFTPRIRHESLPLAELLKRMNRFSNNIMAQMLADDVGGAAVVAQIARDVTGIPDSEIQLINGSGLGEDNRMSARAVCALFLALQRLLTRDHLSIADIFVIVGQEKTGVLEYSLLPDGLITKSGTLDAVSTLAGALPTLHHGILWFAILNGGSNPLQFRTEQGLFLKHYWDPDPTLPAELLPHAQWDDLTTHTLWLINAISM